MTRFEAGLLGVVILLVSAMAGLVATHGNPFGSKPAATPSATSVGTPTATVTAAPTATATAIPAAISASTPAATIAASPTAVGTDTPVATIVASPTAAIATTPTPIADTYDRSMAGQIRYIAHTGGIGIRVRSNCAADSPGSGAWPEGTLVSIEYSRSDCPGWLRVQRPGGEWSWVRDVYLSSTPPTPTPTRTRTPMPAPTFTATPPATATATPTPTPAHDFLLDRMERIAYCGPTRIWGYILDSAGNGLSSHTVKVAATEGGWSTISSPSAANGQYDIVLAPEPKAGRWYVFVVAAGGRELSPMVEVETTATDCAPGGSGVQTPRLDFKRWW